MIIAIGSDHGGYQAKKEIIQHIKQSGLCSWMDFGTRNEHSCDYPDFAQAVCADVAEGRADLGILICGTGIGMSMAANRNPAIRAGLCKDVETAQLSRQHNNANVLCLGARVTGMSDILNIVNEFVRTEFEGGRHQKRIDKI
tara:strand:+ start:44 stop:469 length:426 start_codon:yes stop_codon:yes gene_type:complete